MRLPRPGDIVLYRRESFNIMTWLIHMTTGSQWNHASIIVDGAGPGLVVAEATDKGVVESKLYSTNDTIRIIQVEYDDEDDRLTSIAWARARTGMRYGYLNAFMCGLNNVLVGLDLAIKKTDSIICSELVAESLERAGYDFKKDSSQVSPGDLATYFGVKR